MKSFRTGAACALLIALAACSTTDMNRSTADSSTGYNSSTGSTGSSSTGSSSTGSTSATDTSGGTGSSMAQSGSATQSDRSGQSTQSGSSMAQTQNAQTSSQAGQGSGLGTQNSGAAGGGLAGTWSAPPDANAVVTSVDLVPRSSSDVGSGSMAGAAVGGSTSGSDRVYRITLRLDDGSARTITQESAPAFRSGDRVKLNTDGMIQQR
ncbi:hypothetical protein [Massilia sp. TS11]|uniref:hypothetical protein n=1 Tax=Massilia sp. TS11 TaxID=2908003 RepID=UPI001EDB5EAE|nr:hypothetical protein [Massilia sp. TS11]MCG2585734.1 hypothetical protein [Massilia sp. TS11]